VTYPVAILAGGFGHRLRSVTGENLPKVLVPVLGRPFIDWKLEGLADAGATQVVLLVAHHGTMVREHVGDGQRFRLEVSYVDDGPMLLGTGGALLRALGSLPRVFWVTYGDTLLDVDLAAAEACFDQSDCVALMTVLQNRDRWEPSNVVVGDERVLAYGQSPPPIGAQHIDYGMLAFNRAAWDAQPRERAFGLDAVLEPLIAARRVAAFEVSNRFYDVGTPTALRSTERFLAARGQGPAG
jgi:NDP-sugar pyrophosphorylase family protein